MTNMKEIYLLQIITAINKKIIYLKIFQKEQ